MIVHTPGMGNDLFCFRNNTPHGGYIRMGLNDGHISVAVVIGVFGLHGNMNHGFQAILIDLPRFIVGIGGFRQNRSRNGDIQIFQIPMHKQN